ncbi:MAG: helix-turn-helix domain-containing protein [Defluviitaleaceae bacterium]|nr:helix-turn-helix domain-containing protein [Defluviitaleaceae bacterium]
MAVFRIEKNKNYTIMSNHHLRNVTLSLKAKGLLSQILSLPENWDYTLKGLSHINRESVEAIRTAVLELEKSGYIVRRQKRDDKGKMSNIEYTIFEQPQQPNPDKSPVLPLCDFPITGNPLSDSPTSENATQLNKEKSIKEKINTDSQNAESVPIHSPRVREKNTDGKGTEAFEIYREIIKENIEYDHLRENHRYDHERIDEIVDLMLETVCTSRKIIRIASDDFPAALVKSKFLKLNNEHIEYVLDCLKKNTTEIRNIKKYLLAVLFNAPSTIDSHYSALVAHNMANGKLRGGGKC